MPSNNNNNNNQQRNSSNSPCEQHRSWDFNEGSALWASAQERVQQNEGSSAASRSDTNDRSMSVNHAAYLTAIAAQDLLAGSASQQALLLHLGWNLQSDGQSHHNYNHRHYHRHYHRQQQQQQQQQHQHLHESQAMIDNTILQASSTFASTMSGDQARRDLNMEIALDSLESELAGESEGDARRRIITIIDDTLDLISDDDGDLFATTLGYESDHTDANPTANASVSYSACSSIRRWHHTR